MLTYAGILDSGTSCLVLPDAPVPGMLVNAPFTQWKHMIGGNTKKVTHLTAIERSVEQ
jgi:hypothetical protein